MKEGRSITLIIRGKAHQLDISKYTTCDDVIKMARKNIASLEDNHSYAVFESALGVFKLLPGSTKVLKQIRSWGVSKHTFALEIRKFDVMKSKMASISRAKKTIERLRTLITKHELKCDQKLQTYLHDNIHSTVVNKDDQYVKNITVINKSFETGKQEFTKLPACVMRPVRTPGDGHENISFAGAERTPGVVEECDGDFSDVEDRYNLNDGFISDQCESEHFTDKDELNECVMYKDDDMSLADEESAFEDESDFDSISELERNVLDPNDENSTLNLNNCVIYEDDDEDESAFEDESDCESIFELERNVLEASEEYTTLKLNQIKALFSKGDFNARTGDDDLLDSFMQTFIENEDSDEGMESDCSDLV